MLSLIQPSGGFDHLRCKWRSSSVVSSSLFIQALTFPFTVRIFIVRGGYLESIRGAFCARAQVEPSIAGYLDGKLRSFDMYQGSLLWDIEVVLAFTETPGAFSITGSSRAIHLSTTAQVPSLR